MTSIRRRLLAWLLAGTALAIAAGAVSTFLLAREEANSLADYQLRQMALSFRDHALASGLIPHEDDPARGLEVLVQIWNQEGVRLYLSHPKSGIPDRARLGFADVSANGGRWRVFSVQLRNHVIQVAQPYAVRDRIAARLALRTVWPMVAVLPLLGLLIWLTVGKGLSPIERLARDVGRRSPDALAPLEERGLPREVEPLVRALNDLLRRLHRALETQRAFVADAAHELRTPLTAVRLQAQIAGRAAQDSERREALDSLKLGVERANHLVQQLLTLAREEDQASRAPNEGVALGVAGEQAITMQANRGALRTVLSNLLDNAVRYTPAGGSVELSVARDVGDAVVEVSDSGPGIPAEERARVFDRFYRHSGDGPAGSGLGLAIVKQVVERSGGSIALQDAPKGGLKVVLRLPLAAR
jgi:two-component system OmpR family sensor kinase